MSGRGRRQHGCARARTLTRAPRFGRRPLSLIGLAGMAVGLLALAASFFSPLAHFPFTRWLAVAGMLLFRLTFSLSLGPLPYVITSEVFHARDRGLGVGVSWAANWLANFAVSLLFLPLVALVGGSAVFCMYAGTTLVAMVFVCACLPETMGKSLEQLGDELGEEDAEEGVGEGEPGGDTRTTLTGVSVVVVVESDCLPAVAKSSE